MSIETIYSEIILEKVIKSILDDGLPLTVDSIESRFNDLTANIDLSQPSLDSINSEVATKENASSGKFNSTNQSIQNDLDVAYKTLFDVTNKSILYFDRWRNAANNLESRLQALNLRIDNLLKTQVQKNSHYISDNFIDMSFVDLTNTTTLVDIKSNSVRLQASNNNPTKINLNYLSDSDINFSVLSTRNFKSVTTAPGADVLNALNDQNNFWQSRVVMQTPDEPVTTELKIKLFNEVTNISKISITLHASNNNSPIQITPLISSDGINFNQLSIQNITTSVSVGTFWMFPSIGVTHVKFIMTKSSFDFIDSQSFIYEFGAQDISFYDIGFQINSTQVFQSNQLSAFDINKNPIPFSIIELETCEIIPPNTNIIYSIAASDIANDSNLQWINIDPSNRKNGLSPKKIDLSSGQDFSIDGIGISYNSQGETGFINPGNPYKILTKNTNDKIITTNLISDNIRYLFPNSNERILDYEIDTNINVKLDTLSIFRNTGSQNDKTLVRGIQRGWTFEDPYYQTVVLVKNLNGIVINVGDDSLIVDTTIQHGSILLTPGKHNISIHKEKWFDVPSGLTTLQNLKNVDKFFPFNQKLLIEGYSIDNIITPYLGVDLFAGFLLKQISVADFTKIITDDDYSVFCIDKDVPDSITKSSSSYVFMIKSNESNSDFLDELFSLVFTVSNNSYKYVFIKCELSTLDLNVSPVLSSYTIKVSE